MVVVAKRWKGVVVAKRWTEMWWLKDGKGCASEKMERVVVTERWKGSSG